MRKPLIEAVDAAMLANAATAMPLILIVALNSPRLPRYSAAASKATGET